MILVFSLLMAHVMQRSAAFHQPVPEVPDWGAAQWVGAKGSPSKLFLRATWVLGSSPESVSLMVAATDRFEVHVNGTLVAREDLLGAMPTTRVDLSRMVRPGRNVVAIEVTRLSNRHQTQAAVRLRWQEAGRWQELVSDARWRVESRHRVDPGTRGVWLSPDFDDSTWPRAVELGAAMGGLPQDDTLPSALLEPRPEAIAFWHGDAGVGVGAFELPLRLDTSTVSAAWFGLSVDGTYTLAVNGHVLATARGSAKRLDMHDLAPYLRRGDNRIAVLAADVSRPARLVVGGRVVIGPGQGRDLDAVGDWLVQPRGTPVLRLTRPDGPGQAMVRMRAEQPASWSRGQAATWLAWSAGIALVAVLGVRARVGRRADAAAWQRATVPFAAAAGVMAVALLADLDPRWDLSAAFTFVVPATALGVATVLLAWPDRRSMRVQTT